MPIKDSIPKAQHLDDSIPIAPTRTIIVDIPDEAQEKVDLCIDDGVSISCKPDDGNLQQLENAVPLAIHLVARAVHKNEALPRGNMLTIHKMLAEGAAEETKIILSWLFNTGLLKVFLPKHKFIVWSKEIEQILKMGKVLSFELRTTRGRLVHASAILPLGRHFLNQHITGMEMKMDNDYKLYSINKSIQSDFQMHLKLLEKAKDRISMNLLTLQNQQEDAGRTPANTDLKVSMRPEEHGVL